jgi:osmoprotectant transport system substrate-binding protein
VEAGRVETGTEARRRVDCPGYVWVVLEDDKDLVPAQNLVPVAREEVLNDKIRSALTEVSANLTTQGLQDMNRRVSVDKVSPEQLAQEWVQEHDLGE